MIYTETDLLKVHNLTRQGFNFRDCIDSIKTDKLGTCEGDKVDIILITVSNFYNLTPEDITGLSRLHNVAQARRMFFYISRMLTNKSLSYIGLKSNRDHVTVLHHFKKQTGFLDIGDKETISDVDEITKEYFINLKLHEKQRKDV